MSAEWQEIDFNMDVWIIPASKAKNGITHRVPLTDLALNLLTEIKALSGHSRWIFPAPPTLNKDTHMTGSAIDHALRRSKDAFQNIEGFSPHTLRATTATNMASLRISGETISRILNHAKKGVTEQHYIKHTYDEEKRHALESWSQKLNEIINGETASNVIEIKKAAS